MCYIGYGGRNGLVMVELFIAYFHVDMQLKKELLSQLGMLRRLDKIRCFHDQIIQAGDVWEAEIQAHLESAQITDHTFTCYRGLHYLGLLL
jgi:hypothetical protein